MTEILLFANYSFYRNLGYPCFHGYLILLKNKLKVMNFSKIISKLTFLAMSVILTCCGTGKSEKLEVVSLQIEKSFDLLNDSIFLADVTDIVGAGDNIFLADHTINSIFGIQGSTV